MKTIMVALLSLSCLSIYAEDVWEEFKAELVDAAQQYVKAHASDTEVATWKAKIDTRITEDKSLQSQVLDWFYDNSNKLRDRDPKAIKEACLFFLRLSAAGESPPWQVREHLSRDNIREFIRILREKEVAQTTPKE